MKVCLVSLNKNRGDAYSMGLLSLMTYAKKYADFPLDIILVDANFTFNGFSLQLYCFHLIFNLSFKDCSPAVALKHKLWIRKTSLLNDQNSISLKPLNCLNNSCWAPVAKLAGVPDEVIDLAKQKLAQLATQPLKPTLKEKVRHTTALEQKIKQINPDELSPKQASALLYELKNLQ